MEIGSQRQKAEGGRSEGRRPEGRRRQVRRKAEGRRQKAESSGSEVSMQKSQAVIGVSQPSQNQRRFLPSAYCLLYSALRLPLSAFWRKSCGTLRIQSDTPFFQHAGQARRRRRGRCCS